ncbi:MAG: replicative DNA helicase [Rhodocyclaceae bacterium]|nr:replicative DNA helicase [Rhodocyclaceae bacterium]MBP7991139.1 replicative DNA helicase [Rhodocyclaceae bacterium]
MSSDFSRSPRKNNFGNQPKSIDPAIAQLRVPPHSIEAEQSVLGGLLLDNESLDRITDLLTEVDFYRSEHKLIYQQITRLLERGRPADVITVSEAIEQSGLTDETGGLAYLGELAANTPSAANIRRYAEIVRERAVLRHLVVAGDEIATDALNPLGRDAKELLDTAEQKVFAIAEMGARAQQGFVHINPLLTQVVERIQELHDRENPSEITGVPTGFTDLDRMTSGLQPGDLIIVAGRPSMGKAQPLDAQVRTRTGWKHMGDLQIGDALASVDGQPSMVTGIYPQGVRQVYKVTFSDGRSTECCAEHLWSVHYRTWDAPRVLNTEKLIDLLSKKRYQNRLWIDQHTGDFGHHDELPVDAWLLGALLGDGSLSGSALRFSTASAEMLQRVQTVLPAAMTVTHAGHYDYRIVREDRGHAPGMAGSQPNAIKEALIGLGLWGKDSATKFIPRPYLEANRDVRLNVLRGLLDTDGWVEKWGSVRLSTASQQMANDVAELVRSLGGWCSITTKQPHFTNKEGVRTAGKTAWVCHINHPQPRSLFLLSDKIARLPETWAREKRPNFVSIEPVREVACQCISVSHPTRLYVTDNDIVTHNTAFALNIAEYVAVDVGLPVAVFSMEMGGTQLAMRMLASIGRLDSHRVRTGRLTDDEWSRLTYALGKLHEAPMHIDETGGMNPTDLRGRARRLKRQVGKLGLIVIDYIQLMGSTRQNENRATEVSEISRSLKALARELEVPIIALSQLSRKVEERTDKRPMMSDLRESGAIEQDADVILMMYREDYYKPDTPDKGMAEVIIGKQRNGPTGTVSLAFLGEYTRFENLARS